jgi:hypothetical protein
VCVCVCVCIYIQPLPDFTYYLVEEELPNEENSKKKKEAPIIGIGFSKVLYMVTLCSKYSRALTFSESFTHRNTRRLASQWARCVFDLRAWRRDLYAPNRWFSSQTKAPTRRCISERSSIQWIHIVNVLGSDFVLSKKIVSRILHWLRRIRAELRWWRTWGRKVPLCVCACVRVCVCACVRVNDMYICINLCVCIYMYNMHICIYVCMYIRVAS